MVVLGGGALRDHLGREEDPLLMKWKPGEGVGTQVYLVVKIIQLTLMHLNICKIYLKNCKNNNRGAGSGWLV